MPDVRIDGLTVAYDRAGDGPPLLLLHGVLEDARIWRRQRESLADGFDVIAWDAPGCGRSDDPPVGFDYTACLVGFVEALGVRPHVLGLSWGGGLAMDLAARRPDLVERLVLCDTYAGWKGSLPAEEVRRRLEQCRREVGLPAEAFIPDWMPGLLARPDPALVDEVTAIMSDFHPAGYRAMIEAFAELDLRPLLTGIAHPTLLLWGAEDARSPVSVAADLRSQLPDARLHVIPGAGHLSHLDAPEAFDAAVRDFLT